MENITNLLVCAFLESQVNDELLNALVLLHIGNCELQAGSKCKSLTNGEACEENIFLLHISCVFSEGLFIDWNLVVEEDVTR